MKIINFFAQFARIGNPDDIGYKGQRQCGSCQSAQFGSHGSRHGGSLLLSLSTGFMHNIAPY